MISTLVSSKLSYQSENWHSAFFGSFSNSGVLLLPRPTMQKTIFARIVLKTQTFLTQFDPPWFFRRSTTKTYKYMITYVMEVKIPLKNSKISSWYNFKGRWNIMWNDCKQIIENSFNICQSSVGNRTDDYIYQNVV